MTPTIPEGHTMHASTTLARGKAALTALMVALVLAGCGEQGEKPVFKLTDVTGASFGKTLVLNDRAELGLGAHISVVIHKPVGIVSAQPEPDQVPAARLLTRAGYEVVRAPGEGCCGSLTHHLGKAAAALEAARGEGAAPRGEVGEDEPGAGARERLAQRQREPPGRRHALELRLPARQRKPAARR